MKQRFCPYCRSFRQDEGFKVIVEVRSGSKRGMCAPCQEVRKLPREKLVAMSNQQKIERTKK